MSRIILISIRGLFHKQHQLKMSHNQGFYITHEHIRREGDALRQHHHTPHGLDYMPVSPAPFHYAHQKHDTDEYLLTPVHPAAYQHLSARDWIAPSGIAPASPTLLYPPYQNKSHDNCQVSAMLTPSSASSYTRDASGAYSPPGVSPEPPTLLAVLRRQTRRTSPSKWKPLTPPTSLNYDALSSVDGHSTQLIEDNLTAARPYSPPALTLGSPSISITEHGQDNTLMPSQYISNSARNELTVNFSSSSARPGVRAQSPLSVRPDSPMYVDSGHYGLIKQSGSTQDDQTVILQGSLHHHICANCNSMVLCQPFTPAAQSTAKEREDEVLIMSPTYAPNSPKMSGFQNDI